jgi:serine/threonine-protein kinase
MNTTASERDPFEAVAEDFLSRWRAGEEPSVLEYVERYPELANQIRELFPALVLMEKHRPADKAPADTAETWRSATVPAELGEYRLLREVGRGGMGVVYEAVQVSLQRHVALKVLPLHRLRGPEHLERFRREARIAAGLHHTNIVPVFGVGEHEGIHYYAMQFIRGQGIDEVLREVIALRKERGDTSVTPLTRTNRAGTIAASMINGHFADQCQTADFSLDNPGQGDKDAALPPSPIAGPSRLDPASGSEGGLATPSHWQYSRSVARIGLQVAEALDYAHRQGVLHRDIKPSNLMLDLAGRVWITDFGLAKAEDSEDLTEPDQLVGTLRYMAPERFGGQVGPASDLYSLGATLYELVTLRPAFEGIHRAEVMERVLHSEPVPPRKLDGRIPRDLETIVLKAMAREPLERYRSAEKMATDLRSFLADLPIRARRPSLWERGWRWCRRNPIEAALGAGLVAALLIGICGIAWQWRRAEASFRRADDNAKKARQAFDDAFTLVSESKLINVPGAQPLRRELLQKALAYYQDLVNQGNDDPAARAEQAAAYFRVGTILISLEQDDEALAALENGLGVVEKLLQEGHDDDELSKHLCGFFRSARRIHSQDKLMSHPPEDATTIRRLISIWEKFERAKPALPAARSDLALLHYLEAEIYEAGKRSEEALSAYGEARSLSEMLARQEPEAHAYDELLKRSYTQLGSILENQRRPRDAETIYRDAVAFYEQQAALHPNLSYQTYNLASMLSDLGNFLAGAGRGAEGEVALRRSVNLLEKAISTQPGNPDYQKELASDYHRLGTLLGIDHLQETERVLRRGATLAERLMANFPDVPDYQAIWGRCSYELAQDLALSNRISEGETLLRQVRDSYKNLTARSTHYHYYSELWTTSARLALVLCATDRIDEAEGIFCEEQQRFERLTADHPDMPRSWCCLAYVHCARALGLAASNRMEGANEAIRHCAEIIKEHPAAISKNKWDNLLASGPGWDASFLTRLFTQAGRSLGVESVQRQVIQFYERLASLDPADPWWQECAARSMTRLAEWLSDRSRAREADECYCRAIRCYRESGSSAIASIDVRTDQGELWFLYGSMLQSCLRTGEAADAFRQASTFYEQLTREFPKERSFRQRKALACRSLAYAFQLSGRRADAEKAYRDSLEEFQRLAREFPTDLGLGEERAHALRHLAFVCSNRPEEAHKLFQEALHGSEDLTRRDAQNPMYFALKADTHRRMADLFAAGHQVTFAEDAYRRALVLYEQALPDAILQDYVRKDWRQCVVNYVELLRGSGRARAAEALERQAWARLEERLNDLVQIRPGDVAVWHVRGDWHARRGRWQQAADDMAKAIELNPAASGIWMEYASILLLAGRTEAYRQFCASRLSDLGSLPRLADGPDRPFQVARLCSLAEVSTTKRATVVQAAEQAARMSDAPWFRHVMALACYRAGQWEAAAKWAKRSMADPTWQGSPLNTFILALAAHHTGQSAQARQQLDQAVRAWPEGSRANEIHFHDWLEGQVLLREARTARLLSNVQPDFLQFWWTF